MKHRNRVSVRSMESNTTPYMLTEQIWRGVSDTCHGRVLTVYANKWKGNTTTSKPHPKADFWKRCTRENPNGD